MKLTAVIITTIKEAFEKLDPEGEFEISAQDMEVGDEKVSINFPSEPEIVELRVDELLNYIRGFEELQFDTEIASTKTFTQMPVYCFDKPIDYIINEINFTVAVPTRYKIRLVQKICGRGCKGSHYRT